MLTTPSAAVSTYVYAIDFDTLVGACVVEGHDHLASVSLTEALPSDWYVDPSHLDDELTQIFDRSCSTPGRPSWLPSRGRS